ncbi:MAG TPA: response regulator [Polyangiaceae bacterium]
MSRVLVVDDDEAVRIVVEAVLRADGHDVATAGDGETALGLLGHSPAPSLVLLDLMMPRLSGWDVLEAMAHRPQLADVPVLVLTGYDEVGGLPGCCHVLHKPIDADVLRERVRQLEG